ncbi:hypothetical protein [Mycobacterium numidiamassiliense]|nr:hypothetical protein [Mycobacterium numidiamassiliense]
MLVAGKLISGCSFTSKTTSSSRSATKSSSSVPGTSSSSSTESTASAPLTTLDSSQCVGVNGANADLLAANDKDVARKAADTLERYSPPSDVKDATEHFVSTGGAHFDDPDFTKNLVPQVLGSVTNIQFAASELDVTPNRDPLGSSISASG